MGDRANVIVKCGGEQVCLYTHWGGYELPKTVQSALIRGLTRLDDFQYLTRIVFCEMIQGDVLGQTGFGISQKEHDGGNTVFLDVESGTIKLNDGGPIPMLEYTQQEGCEW